MNLGWKCPGCGNYYSPAVTQCPTCGTGESSLEQPSPLKVVSSTTTDKIKLESSSPIQIGGEKGKER